MIYALLLVCLASEPICDKEHAIIAEQSPPIFASEYECRVESLRHLHDTKRPELKQTTEYALKIECRRADNGA